MTPTKIVHGQGLWRRDFSVPRRNLIDLKVLAQMVQQKPKVHRDKLMIIVETASKRRNKQEGERQQQRQMAWEAAAALLVLAAGRWGSCEHRSSGHWVQPWSSYVVVVAVQQPYNVYVELSTVLAIL